MNGDRRSWVAKAWNDFAIWRRLDWDLSGRPKEGVPGSSVQRMLSYLVPFWPLIVLTFVLTFVGIVLGTLPAFILKDIINQDLPSGRVSLLLHSVLDLALVLFLGSLVGAAATYVHGKMTAGIVQDLRADLFSRLLRQSPDEAAERGAERTSTRVINDIGIVGTGFAAVASSQKAMSGVVGFLDTTLAFISNAWAMLVMLVAMFVLDWHLALVYLISVPPLFLLTFLVARVQYTMGRREYESIADVNAVLVRSVGFVGSAFARMMGQQRRQHSEFDRANAALTETSIAARVIRTFHDRAYTLPIALTTVFIWFYGGLQVMHGTMSMGTLIAFAVLLTKHTYTLGKFMGAFVNFPHLRSVLDRIFAMWPSAEGVRLAFLRRRQAARRRLSPWNWLRAHGVDSRAPMPSVRGSSLWRLVKLTLPYWPYWLLGIGDTLLTGVVLSSLVPLAQKAIINTAIPQHNVALLGFSVLIIGLYSFGRLFTIVAGSSGHEFVSHRSLQRLRTIAYDKLRKTMPASYRGVPTAGLMSRVVNDINALYSAFGELSDLVWMFLPVIPAFVLMGVLNWRLGLLTVLVTLLFVPLLGYGARLFYAINRRTFEVVEELNGFLLRELEPDRIAACADESVRERLEQEFAKSNDELADLGFTSTVAHGWFTTVFNWHGLLVTSLTWLAGGWMIMHGQMLLGTVVALLVYAGKVEGFGGAFGVYLVMRTMQSNADRVFTLLDDLDDRAPTDTAAGVPEGAAVTVTNLELASAAGPFTWQQSAGAVYGVNDPGAATEMREVLAGIAPALRGEIGRRADVGMVAGDTPVPRLTLSELLSTAAGRELSDREVRQALEQVGLDRVTPALVVVAEEWTPQAIRCLSLALVLLHRPDVVVADCSAVNGRPLRDWLPGTAVVSAGGEVDFRACDRVVQPDAAP